MDIEPKGSDYLALKEAKSIVADMQHGLDYSDVFEMPQRVGELLYKFGSGMSAAAITIRNSLDYRAKVLEFVHRLQAGEEILLGADTDPEDLEDQTLEEAVASCQVADPDGRTAPTEAESPAPQAET